MPRTESYALNHARQALSLMTERNIEPTPVNYAVWYHYIACDKGELNKEIDLLLKRKTPPTDDVALYLYNKYISRQPRPEEKAAEQTSQNTQTVLAEIMDVIDRFSGDTQNYSDQIDVHVAKLSQKITDPTLKEMAREIVSRATSMRESGMALNQKLEESRREVVTLKTNLEKITNESNKDFLTGTANRKAFESRIDELSQWAKEKSGDVCLLMIDVDHFKRFNDKYGHQIGDEVLRRVGRSLLDSVKGKDLVARYGGEEFAVLLQGTPLSTGLIVAENIRKNIAETDLVRKDTGESLGAITVSIGVAHFRVDSDSVPLFISRADASLYRSKMGGRNRVTPENFDPV